MIQSMAVTGGSRRLPSGATWERSRGQPGGPAGANDLRRERAGSHHRAGSPRGAGLRARSSASSPCSRCAASPSSSGWWSARATSPPARSTPSASPRPGQHGDYAAMYAELTRRRRAIALPRARFTAAYEDTLRTATGTKVDTARPRKDGSAYRVPVPHPDARLRHGARATVVRADRRASAHRLVAHARRSRGWRGRAPAPRDAAADARDAAGPRPHGRWPRATTARRRSLRRAAGRRPARADPARAQATSSRRSASRPTPRSASRASSGSSTSACSATPGGELRRRRARARRSRAARRRRRVRTTISLPVQQAAVTALARPAGRRRRGAAAHAARCSPSPASPSRACSRPGSTFKMITVDRRAGGGDHEPADRPIPVADQADARGRRRSRTPTASRAAARSCVSFATSCNSVFAPLGAQLGAKRLVDDRRALRLQPAGRHPRRRRRARSRRPARSATTSRSARRRSARARVQATALQMATVAATIGLRGRRPHRTLDYAAAHGRRRPRRAATSPRVARTMERLHAGGVVRDGTGVRAAIPGVRVAGKTGTAELRTTKTCEPDRRRTPRAARPRTRPTTRPTPTPGSPPTRRPARPAPRVAVGVLLVAAGAGGDTAAPVGAGRLNAAALLSAPARRRRAASCAHGARIGLAARPGTAVDPTCSRRAAT